MQKFSWVPFLSACLFVFAVLCLAAQSQDKSGGLSEPGGGGGVLVLTRQEQADLQNLQLRRQLMDAQYQAALFQWRADEAKYVSEVLTAHPGVAVKFDPQSVSWVSTVGEPVQQPAEGSKK